MDNFTYNKDRNTIVHVGNLETTESYVEPENWTSGWDDPHTFAWREEGSIFYRIPGSCGDPSKVYKSPDNGGTWEKIK